MLSIVYGIIALSLLILVHEIGHLVVARLSGVKVIAFSLGFGKKLISVRKGETEYALSLVPLGGYVKLLGESTEDEVTEEERHRSYSEKPAAVRLAIAFAGPFANFAFAFLIFWVVLFSGYQVQSSKIGTVAEGYPAYAGGIKEGDVIVSIDGKPVAEFEDIRKILAETPVRPVKFTIRRGSAEPMDLMITPREVESKNIFGDPIRLKLIGVGPSGDLVTKNESLFSALVKAGQQTYRLSELTIVGIGKLIQGRVSRKEIGGPIMILQMAGKQATQGKSNFFYFIALISINLAVLNLCPIPILDGGHILFSLIEIIFRRKVPERVVNAAQYVGLALIITIMVIAVGNDLDRSLHIYDKFEKIIGGK